MRLLISYKGINKILRDVQTYSGIVKFVNENFFLKLSKWTITYIDSDGDRIALDSEIDVQNMLSSATKDHLKAVVQDELEDTLVSTQKMSKSEDKPVIQKKQLKQSKEEKNTQIQEKSSIFEEKPEENTEENIEENDQILKLVDSRVQLLIPCLTKKIESMINGGEESKYEESSTKHNVKCTGCGIKPIFGIRYKCTVCPVFNFCSQCQSSIVHPHNMIKMRYLEEKQNQFKKEKGGKDELFLLTKKAFKLSSHLGGVPEDYRDFVNANKDLSHQELCHAFLQQNSQVQLSDSIKRKIEKKCKKLGFYFNEPSENFEEFIKQRPLAKCTELIEQIKVRKEKSQSEKVEEPKIADQKFISPGFDEIAEIEGNNQEVPEFVMDEPVLEEPRLEEPKLIEPKVEEPKIEEKKFQKPKQIDILKRNRCIIEMKEIFGEEKVFEYLRFFDQHYDQKIEDIIAKYVCQLNEKPIPVEKKEEKKVKKIDIIKRNKFILEMKDLFGEEKVFEYLGFYDQHSDETNENIIAKYIACESESVMKKSMDTKKVAFLRAMEEILGRKSEEFEKFYHRNEKLSQEELIEKALGKFM